MINISTNITQVIERIEQSVLNLANTSPMTREMATTGTALMRDRIHTEGKASDESEIGSYSEGYMKVRTGAFKNTPTKTKGKNKGALKGSGTFEKGESSGSSRPVYNRSSDKKVILSLTRQMENDMGICATDPIELPGGHGIGFNNPENYKKARWCEDTYHKKIYNLTPSEKKVMEKIIQKHTKNALS